MFLLLGFVTNLSKCITVFWSLQRFQACYLGLFSDIVDS
jgi:hypothetical protein